MKTEIENKAILDAMKGVSLALSIASKEIDKAVRLLEGLSGSESEEQNDYVPEDLKMLSAAEVASLLGVGYQSLMLWIKSGEFYPQPHLYCGNSPRWYKGRLLREINERKGK